MTNLVFMHAHEIIGLLFAEQTVCFTVTSNRSYAYLVIFYVYNANLIASVPIKNCTKEELLQAYKVTYNYYVSCFQAPSTPDEQQDF